MDGRKEKVIINVAIGQKANLMSATMNIGWRIGMVGWTQLL